MTLFDIIAPDVTSIYVEGVIKNRATMLGEALFPKSTVKKLSNEMFRDSESHIIPIKSTSPEAATEFRDPGTFSRISTDFPEFKEGIYLRSHQIEELDQFLNSKDASNVVKDYVENVYYKPLADIVYGVDVIMEIMRMQLLAKGKINYDNKRNSIIADYKVSSKRFIKLTAEETFTDPTKGKPLTHFRNMRKKLKQLGYNGAVDVLLTSDTLDKICATDEVKSRIYIDRNVSITEMPTVEKKVLKRFIADDEEYKIRFVVNDDVYTNPETGLDEQYFPNGYCTMYPRDAKFGDTLFGRTATKIAVDAKLVKIDIKEPSKGVYMFLDNHVDPIKTKTIVEAKGMPKCNNTFFNLTIFSEVYA